ncbi:MAG: BlaI/MecI/CopY family transcriptional regulator [bacterium]
MKKSKRNPFPKPTEAELAILHILWRRGPSTAREIQQEMGRAKTTVLTLLQIMARKGLVQRDESTYAHVYEACVSQDQTQKHLLGDIARRAFDGSTYQMVMKALSMKKLSEDELKEIYKILENYQT